jgi:hypothetical protein
MSWVARTVGGEWVQATKSFVIGQAGTGEPAFKALTDVDVELILGDVAKEADVKEPVIREMLIRISNDLRTIDLSTLILALSVPTDTNESRGSPTSSGHGSSNVSGGGAGQTKRAGEDRFRGQGEEGPKSDRVNV